MTPNQQQVRRVLEAIEEKTDIMYNAILVDNFEVFESNLLFRDQLLCEYDSLKQQLTPVEISQLGSDQCIRRLIKANEDINRELQRFKNQIQSELREVGIEKNKLQTNQKKTNQYHLRTDATLSGNYFDKKK